MRIVTLLLARRVAKAMQSGDPALAPRKSGRASPDAPRKLRGALRRAENMAVRPALLRIEGDAHA